MIRVTAVLRENRAIAVLIALYLVLGVIYSVVTPVFEAGDEIWHYPFVQFVAGGHVLPVQDPARRDLWAQEGGQPPLYYALSAAATFWIDTRDLPDRLWRNPYAKVGIPLAYGNKNLIVHTSAEDWLWHNTPLAVHLIRFFSLLLGAGTVLLTYLLAKEVAPPLPPHSTTDNVTRADAERRPALVALFAAALVAFNPMFLFISASVNNDSLAVALASLALLLIVQLATRGLAPRRLLGVGIVCGLGALSKVSDLGLVPLALLVAAWVSWSKAERGSVVPRLARALRPFLLAAFLIIFPALVIAGWWYVRNYVLYADPLAFNVWLRISGGRAVPATILTLIDEFQGFRISFWGNFGGVNLIAPDWVYALLDVITAAAAVGLAIGVVKRRLSWNMLIPALWLGIIIAGLVRWTLLTYASQGRLIFPAISSVAVLMAFGLASLGSAVTEALVSVRAANRQRYIPVVPGAAEALNWIACACLLTFAVAAPFLIIAPAYALPLRAPGNAAAPNPVHISYLADEAKPELVGYEIGRSVKGGQELPLTLYWRTSQAVAQDLYVYIHLYDASDNLVGQWEAFPGNGLYPTRLWQPNEMLVDHYRVPVSFSDIGPQVGRVEVGLTPVGSTVPLPALNPAGDTIIPSIAHFKIAAPAASVPPTPDLFQFDGLLALTSLQFSASRGGRVFKIDPTHLNDSHLFGADVLHIAFTLRALKPPDDDYILFVHVVDRQGNILVQHDDPPGGSSYPTSFWDANESVDGQFDLGIPNSATAGDYQVELGMYHSNGGARLPVQGNAEGNLVTAGDHLVLSPVSIGK